MKIQLSSHFLDKTPKAQAKKGHNRKKIIDELGFIKIKDSMLKRNSIRNMNRQSKQWGEILASL